MTDTREPIQSSAGVPELERMLTIGELAEHLRVPVKTVYTWNSKGCAPRRVQVGKHLLYPVSGIAEWLASRTVDQGVR